MVRHHFIIFLLHVRRTAQFQGEGMAGSASLGRGTQITRQRVLVWTQGGQRTQALSAGPTPGHHCWRWQDSTGWNQSSGSPALGSSLWWRRWQRWRRDNSVQSLRRTVATVGPTWAEWSGYWLCSHWFSTLMGPASPSAMEGGWVSSAKKESSLQEVSVERHVVLSGLLSTSAILVHKKIKSTAL